MDEMEDNEDSQEVNELGDRVSNLFGLEDEDEEESGTYSILYIYKTRGLTRRHSNRNSYFNHYHSSQNNYPSLKGHKRSSRNKSSN